MVELIKKYQGFANRYFINFIILIVTWGGMLRRSFNCDTLWHMVDLEGDIFTQIEDARYLCSLTDFLLSKLGVSTTDHTGITILVSLLILAAATCIIQSIFEEYLPNDSWYFKAGFYAITNLIFVNVLFAEPLMFCECALAFALAYFLGALSVYSFKKKRYVASFVIMLCAVCYYQTAAVFGLILVSGFIYFENGKIITKKVIIAEIIGGVCTMVPAMINMFSSNVLVWLGVIPELRKTPGVSGFGDKLNAIAGNFTAILRDGMTLLPFRWLTLLIYAIAILLICRNTVIRNKGQLVYSALLIAAVNIMIYIIPFMSAAVLCYPRLVFVFYTAMSITLLAALSEANDVLGKVFSVIIIGYVLIHMVRAQMIVSEHMLSNQLDILYANAVYHEILEYQGETGIIVENLAVVKDIDAPVHYEEVDYAVEQINERALGVVTATLMNIVTDGHFNRVDMDEAVYEEFFKDKDWKYFNPEEQLIIIGDTAYWVIF